MGRKESKQTKQNTHVVILQVQTPPPPGKSQVALGFLGNTSTDPLKSNSTQ